MPIFSKASSRTGLAMQVAGYIIFGAGFIISVIWALFVLHSTLGNWATVIGGILAPMTFMGSVFIVWVSTGHFPVLLMVVFLAALFGVALSMFGGLWDGGDD